MELCNEKYDDNGDDDQDDANDDNDGIMQTMIGGHLNVFCGDAFTGLWCRESIHLFIAVFNMDWNDTEIGYKDLREYKN